MGMVINTNVASSNSVRLLDQANRSQETTMQRLTSGLRINTAKDDAAGMSVATGMTTQIRGMDMAIRNANDGLSMMQTLDSAVSEVTNMMQRMYELSMQSQTGTYNEKQREAMDIEFQQLGEEIGRLSSAMTFNGVKIFDTGAMSDMSIHVGWQAGEGQKIGVGSLVMTTGLGSMSTSMASMSLKTASGASAAAGRLQSMMEDMDLDRSRWGAIMNRLDYTVNSLQANKVNTEASRSRVMDTDYAQEAANLARTQVLQQAGMAMLSQSNSQGQNVLSLLR